ncbi:uncharacterized protein LOC111068849 [Drosophila obscura]|uniref:uncharacterized protein LOC111068849 n=1 Tax=Drosophila obscura TaxID=7282 RepID=UPI000BA11245|nr:uncharacterized protein LOC111068849 [Drosophila obscura]
MNNQPNRGSRGARPKHSMLSSSMELMARTNEAQSRANSEQSRANWLLVRALQEQIQYDRELIQLRARELRGSKGRENTRSARSVEKERASAKRAASVECEEPNKQPKKEPMWNPRRSPSPSPSSSPIPLPCPCQI